MVWLLMGSKRWSANEEHLITTSSSSAKRTPPTGARKTAAMPAAAPQVITWRRSLSFFKYLSYFHVKWYLRDPPYPSKEAMQAPVWTMGPSLPTINPANTLRMEPKIFTSRILGADIEWASMPLRYAFTSGMAEAFRRRQQAIDVWSLGFLSFIGSKQNL